MKFGKEKIKNIWFYYKWHILIGIFLLTLFTVLLSQCVTKEDADLYIYWAGPVYLTDNAQKEISGAFDAVIPDDCAKSIAMITTVYGNKVNIGATPSENEQYYVDYTGKKATLMEFKNQMRLPNTVICLLSPACFEHALSDGETLRPLSDVLEALPENGVVGEGYGITLSALPFYQSNSALKNLPEDTVLCVKSPSFFRNDKDYEKALIALRALCAFGNS